MRRAFNILEIAIVLIIILMLVALLLTLLPKVHVAAARVRCANNLKQHGLAIHNYHDANTHLPPGTLPNPELPPEQRLSFHVALLPYVECDKLYSQVAKAEPWDSDRNVGLLAHRTFKLYQCPAWIEFHGYDANLAASGHTAYTHYVGVAGVGADAATRPADAPGIGIFGYDRTITLKDVKDGTENTAMIFETGRDVGPWCRGGPSTVRAVGVDDTEFGGTHFRRTWMLEKRTNGFNVLLADGSVRHTKPEVDAGVLGALVTVAGREVIPPDW